MMMCRKHVLKSQESNLLGCCVAQRLGPALHVQYRGLSPQLESHPGGPLPNVSPPFCPPFMYYPILNKDHFRHKKPLKERCCLYLPSYHTHPFTK